MSTPSKNKKIAEVNAENAPAPVTRKTRQRVAALVLPPYSLKNVKSGDSFAVKVLTEIVTKPDIDQETGQQKLGVRGVTKGKPIDIHIVQVADLDTGAIGELLLPFIMHKALAGAGEITGRCFEMVKGKAETNKATMWEVYEIEAE